MQLLTVFLCFSVCLYVSLSLSFCASVSRQLRGGGLVPSLCGVRSDSCGVHPLYGLELCAQYWLVWCAHTVRNRCAVCAQH